MMSDSGGERSLLEIQFILYHMVESFCRVIVSYF